MPRSCCARMRDALCPWLRRRSLVSSTSSAGAFFAPDLSLNFILHGECNVGKTSLRNRWVDGIFTGDVAPTFGVDFNIKTLDLVQEVDEEDGEEGVDERIAGVLGTGVRSRERNRQEQRQRLTKQVPCADLQVKINVYDTSGKPGYREVNSKYLLAFDAVLFVYDISSMSTLHELRRYFSDPEHREELAAKKKAGMAMILIGNKCDLPLSQRQVGSQTGQDTATEFGIPFVEVSAKTGANVREAFMFVTTRAVGEIIARDRLKGRAVNGGSSASSLKRTIRKVRSLQVKQGALRTRASVLDILKGMTGRRKFIQKKQEHQQHQQQHLLSVDIPASPKQGCGVICRGGNRDRVASEAAVDRWGKEACLPPNPSNGGGGRKGRPDQPDRDAAAAVPASTLAATKNVSGGRRSCGFDSPPSSSLVTSTSAITSSPPSLSSLGPQEGGLAEAQCGTGDAPTASLLERTEGPPAVRNHARKNQSVSGRRWAGINVGSSRSTENSGVRSGGCIEATTPSSSPGAATPSTVPPSSGSPPGRWSATTTKEAMETATDDTAKKQLKEASSLWLGKWGIKATTKTENSVGRHSKVIGSPASSPRAGGVTSRRDTGFTSPSTGGVVSPRTAGVTSDGISRATSPRAGGATSPLSGGVSSDLVGGATPPPAGGVPSPRAGGFDSPRAGRVASPRTSGVTSRRSDGSTSPRSGGLSYLQAGGVGCGRTANI